MLLRLARSVAKIEKRRVTDMRIVIVDLHCNSFLLRDFRQIITKDLRFPKHAFFLKEAVSGEYEVLNYITGTQSNLLLGKHILFLNKLEAKFVLRKNGLKNNVLNITNKTDIKEDDLVIFYSHFNDMFNIAATPGQKYCNMNHFFSMRSGSHNRPIPDFLFENEFDGYICEADVLNDSAFFRRYFPIEKKRLILLPYVAEKRFKKRKSFDIRKNKAIALGSFCLELDVLTEFYGKSQLHPMRYELLNRKNENREQLEVCVEKLILPKAIFEITSNENIIRRKVKAGFNYIYSSTQSPFRKKGKNAGYYSQDRVSILNDYKMFIYPEEVTGIPALGFVEGMSCGCAYIGLESPMYSKLGMKAGVHYIGYDGSYEDLVRKIKYYQNHEIELKRIAINGYKFVRENLTSKKVFERFIEQYKEKK